jgi:hypothetical protein
MDTERPDTQIEPDALDQAIQAALNVDPSPEFLARVRARIADERPARPWTMTVLPVLAAAATLAILALVANTSRRPPPEPVVAATVPVAEPRDHGVEPRAEATVSGSSQSTAIAEAAPTAPKVQEPRPEPLRRPAATRLSHEARGLQALVHAIDRGSVIIVADDLQSSRQRPTEIRGLEITPLMIPSISADPIVAVAQ